MSSHLPGVCDCGACRALARLHILVSFGADVGGFLDSAAQRLRIAEGELRDLLDRLKHPELVNRPPVAPNLEYPTVDGRPPPLPEEPEDKPAADQEKEASLKVEEVPKESEADPEEKKAAPEEKASKTKVEKKTKEKRKKKKDREDSPEDRRREKRVREARSPSEEASRKEKKRKESEEPAKEKAASSRPPPEPERSPIRREIPRPKGKGWKGPIPYSDHPRWWGKNKGIVKRAKQERRDQSRYDRWGAHRKDQWRQRGR